MDPQSSKKMVVWSMAGVATVVIVKNATSGSWPTPTTFLGIAVVYIILGFMADFAPQVAGPLALLAFIAVLLSEGEGAFQGVSRRVSQNRTRKNLRVIPGGRPA